MRSRIWLGLLAGTIGGFAGWFMQEQLINYNNFLQRDIGTGEVRVLALCVGGLTGMFLGAVDGIAERSPRKLAIGIAGGAAAGFFLGFIGLFVGNIVYSLLGGTNSLNGGGDFLAFIRQVIARTLGWAMLGLGIGAGSALVSRSPQRIRNGAIGGFLGGLIGGFVFDLLAHGAVPITAAAGASGLRDVGGPSRMVGFTLIGGLTGFFIGLVEELLKQAWVKVLAGRNEGKDFILYKSMNLLGRDERCDVPLFGDPSVAVQHAAIRADGRRHFLLAAATPTGTLVNGQAAAPQSEVMLRDGDMIQIGAHRILFREKATASRLTQPNLDDAALKKAGPGAVPIPSHLCPFCGAPKDASGNCRCSLGAAPGAPVGGGVGAYPPPPAGMPGGYAPAPMGGYSASTAVMGAYDGGSPITAAIGQIVGLEGAYAGQVFPLQGMNMEVGRDAGKDIVLSADSTVSRGHARLVQENGALIVVDLGSSNGTYVNGQRVAAPMQLVPGDVVQFGASKFRYE
jgi:pSer/pThr/pTyr-binding forkhead associated (FHA) protein